MADVTDLQSRISSIVDQDDDAPTAGGDIWDLRLKYLNRAQGKWQEAYDWPQLYKEVFANTSQPTANVSIAMPTDFRKLAGYPVVIASSTDTESEYPQIDPQKRKQYSSTEEYCYVLGEPSGGHYLILNPGSLISGASIFYNYWANSGTLASPANISMCPDPEYLVSEAIAQLWEAREDPRYPEMKLEADRKLAQMIENDTVKGYGYDNKADMPEDTKYSHRWGRN